MPKIIVPLLILFALGACNTMKGAGQDVSAAGHAVSTTATDTQEKM